MATPQLSPGVLTREVDLTVGRADNVLDNIGAIAGPFSIGPVDQPVDITTENQLIQVFGKPLSTDAQYEYWMSASSYLSYGGVLKVARTDGTTLNNANAGVGIAYSTAVKIKNFDDYQTNWEDDVADYVFAAKNPGSWANNLKVCMIDDKADQTIGISTVNPGSAGAVIGYGVTAPLNGVSIPGSGSVETFTGYLKGIITGVTTDTTNGNSSFDVKIVSRVSSAGTETAINYAQNTNHSALELSDTIVFKNNSGITTGNGSVSVVSSVNDWYDQQTLGLTNSTIYWSSLAPKPVSNNYVTTRSGKNDALHIVVVDDTGTVTGIQGNLLEKHLNLSKASDSVSTVNSPQKNYWKEYLAVYSSYLFVGDNPSLGNDSYHNTTPIPTGFSSGFTAYTQSQGSWNVPAQGVTFSSLGNVTYNFGGGVDYSSNGGMTATLGDLMTSYNLFSNKDEIQVDYLIMGPGLSGDATTPYNSQAKANYLISIAQQRGDCVAVISPHRLSVVGLTNTNTQTDNIIKFFSPLQSSSYAIFDSGYKYTYDRFNNQFRYIPCNADVAGLMCRTNIVAYPWFSPAGQQRGVLNNAIKLAYNPSKAQRDQLYPLRINSIVNQPGIGVLLFGDKTALGYASAFDRINVRRLFLTIEQALQRSAQAQLFELNDQITRANFVNIVEPYLRDIQAKRGLYGYLVVCDETNNTPDVIDNNEFRADIYLKPAKSINYVTLTFVATRTGVSFEEVAGTV
jgi:phage terminase large subunit-like protein